MFSFHKPKIYRSNLGCCICKAKSSSSRFTDSKKYENEFERCFRIQDRRSGEICNACVLLVKRWKKLSPDNRLTKHWHHVVDARAGPGTKLTNIRRIASSSSASSSSTHASSSSSAASALNQQQQHSKSDPLPLTSSQSANSGGQQQQQSSSSGGPKSRTGSFSSNRARAVDTNVSTFTFGETTRRSYMALESNYFNAAAGASSLSKPQSALNSSAFELVIKRFRQRQQQQQIEATRRQQNKLQRIQRRQQQQPGPSEAAAKRQLPVQQSETDDDTDKAGPTFPSAASLDEQPEPLKRAKRLSESIGPLAVDGFRITNLLDGSIWRKEKTCCGIIFRGLHNEVAVFPRLLRPCQQQSAKKRSNHPLKQQPARVEPLREVSPPPRATKSGSVSSCDSNTSGTGSMDCPQVDYAEAGGSKLQQLRRVLQRKSELRLRTGDCQPRCSTASLGKRNTKQQKLHSPGLNSSSSSSEETCSSGASMSHLMLMDEEEGIVCEIEMEEDFESSTDGSSASLSSSASDSLATERRRNAKKSSNPVVEAAS